MTIESDHEISKKVEMLIKVIRRELALKHSESGIPTKFVWHPSFVWVELDNGCVGYTIELTVSMGILIADIAEMGGELP